MYDVVLTLADGIRWPPTQHITNVTPTIFPRSPNYIAVNCLISRYSNIIVYFETAI